MLIKKSFINGKIIFGNGDIILPLSGIEYAICGEDNFLLIWGDNALPTIEKILKTNPSRFKGYYYQVYVIHSRKIMKLTSLKYSSFSVFEEDLKVSNTYIEFSINAKNIAKRLKSIIKKFI